MPATVFGRYEIIREIGRGGMAHVYLALDPTFRREVAVKVLPPHYLENPLLRARFEREARLIATIEHPAIVPVYDFGEHEEQLYLVMRYMSGGSLVARIHQAPLSLAQASEYLTLLAPALDAVHARDIVHRDLKPGNILLDAFGNPALSDFGIAHLSEATVDLTGEAIIGTPAYMSPEQVRGDVTLDGRSDIYSLGIILFEMLTGHQPYQATTPMSAAMRHLTDPVPQIRQSRPELPDSLQPVLDRALAKDRDQRYPRATDLAFDLRALVDEQATARVSPGSSPAAATSPAVATVMDTRPGLAASPGPAAAPKSGATLPALNPSVPAAPRPGSSASLRWLGLLGVVFVLALVVFVGARLLRAPGSIPTPTTATPTSSVATPTLPTVESTLPAVIPTLPAVTPTLPAVEPTQPAVTPTEPAFTPTLPAAEPTPALADDFSSPANGWPQDRQVAGGFIYQDGAYVISVRENQQAFWAAPDESFADLQVQVQAQRLSGDLGFYGVICRLQDSGDFYFFAVRPDGFYKIGIYLDGGFQTLIPGDWTFHEAVQTGASTNLLQADCGGDRLRFSVNGVFLEEVSDPTLASGKPGLLAADLDNQTFEAQFDDFRVFSPVP